MYESRKLESYAKSREGGDSIAIGGGEVVNGIWNPVNNIKGRQKSEGIPWVGKGICRNEEVVLSSLYKRRALD